MSYLEIAREFESETFKGRVDRPSVEHWEFRHLEIPSQDTPEKVDIWLVGERQDKHEIIICYVGIKARSTL